MREHDFETHAKTSMNMILKLYQKRIQKKVIMKKHA